MSAGTDPFGNPFDRPKPRRGLDPVAMFLVDLHRLLGHGTAQRYVGGEAYDPATCVLCAFERNPTPGNKQAVYDAIGSPISPFTA